MQGCYSDVVELGEMRYLCIACMLRVWDRYFTYVQKYDILYNIIHYKGMERHFNVLKCICIVDKCICTEDRYRV